MYCCFYKFLLSNCLGNIWFLLVPDKLFKEPFLKVESTTQHYRPLYIQMSDWPLVNMDTAANTCPFDGKGLGVPRRSARGDKDGKASYGNEAVNDTNAAGLPGSHSGIQRR
jgi:hypothetical protein